MNGGFLLVEIKEKREKLFFSKNHPPGAREVSHVMLFLKRKKLNILNYAKKKKF